ncbi:unnamed protein product [Didymodactylos carnosus]|uniref:TGF-beta family profile domain-containing protein n=1 Tax=Didymodactylos carnosus TaxID=1234261 RepID=A0A814IX07_9BILA|nr:unnamed protein product [Didymodactylos carnosus]CAF1030356.1 unnamed protein product [Didymodactylos carnosus]CAF3615899.1 unnamed protein product [Didymodactylos carnosus]CAF3801260.1 unnamed protein product [Didymodactylos carnosus]
MNSSVKNVDSTKQHQQDYNTKFHHRKTKQSRMKRQLKLETLTSSSERDTNENSMFSLKSTNCSTTKNISHKTSTIQWLFDWTKYNSRSIEDIQIIYHLTLEEEDDYESQNHTQTIPLRTLFRTQSSSVLLNTSIILKWDFVRKFYFANLSNIFKNVEFKFIANESIYFETILISNEMRTCENVYTYLIVTPILSTNYNIQSSSTTYPSTTQFSLFQITRIQRIPSESLCKLRKIQINFEDINLAHIIIYPKEYTFYYCYGSCAFPGLQHSLHGFIQSLASNKNSNIPMPNCAPSLFDSDTFMLRDIDNSVDLRTVNNIVVKECACL